MRAVKGNKEYTIDEAQQKGYQEAGFDIVEDGEVIAYGRGKTVPYDDHMKAVKEIENLRGIIAELKGTQNCSEASEESQKDAVKKTTKKASE